MSLKLAHSPARLLALLGVLAVAAAPAGRTQEVCQDTQVYLADNTRANYSLGYEHYKNADYCAALPYLRWIVRQEPLFVSQGAPDDRNFRRLMEAYEGIAQTAQGATRRAYLDSVGVVRAQMQQTLDAQGIEYDRQDALLAEGFFYAQHYSDYPDQAARAYDLYVEAFRMMPDSTEDYHLNALAQLASARAAAGDLDPLAALQVIEEAIPYADDAAYLEGVRETFRVDPFAQWEPAYEAYLEGDRSEPVVLTVFAGTVQIDSLIAVNRPDVNVDSLRQGLYPILLELSPTPELLVYVGEAALRDERFDEGLAYFQRAADMTPDSTARRDRLSEVARLLYRAARLQEAYDYAGRALELDPTHGPSHYYRALVVASYLTTGSTAERAAAWCVADMFAEAAAMGGDHAARARDLAADYAARGPAPDEYAGQGWEAGERIEARTPFGACSTTVR